MPASCAPIATPAVFGVSGYSGGGKELIKVHEKDPRVEPFGLCGVELTHKHVPEMKKYSNLSPARSPVRAVGRPLSAGHADHGADPRATSWPGR